MKMTAKVETPAGFQWAVSYDPQGTLIIGVAIDDEMKLTPQMFYGNEFNIENQQIIDFVTSVLGELAMLGFNIVSADVDGVPLSEEFIENLYPQEERGNDG